LEELKKAQALDYLLSLSETFRDDVLEQLVMILEEDEAP